MNKKRICITVLSVCIILSVIVYTIFIADCNDSTEYERIYMSSQKNSEVSEYVRKNCLNKITFFNSLVIDNIIREQELKHAKEKIKNL